MKRRSAKIQVDLQGEQGNAFALMGILSNILQTYEGRPKPEISLILEEMMKGDYKHLVDTFEREVGDYCDIYGYHDIFEEEEIPNPPF